MGSLQPSRTAEFLAYLGQGRRRAAAEPEEALRSLQAEAGRSPRPGVEARLGAPVAQGGSGTADKPAATVSSRRAFPCPVMRGSSPFICRFSSPTWARGTCALAASGRDCARVVLGLRRCLPASCEWERQQCFEAWTLGFCFLMFF